MFLDGSSPGGEESVSLMVTSECSRVLWFWGADEALGKIGPSVPINAPRKSMFQHVTLLPASRGPAPISAEQVDRHPVVADGYGVSRFAARILDTRALWPPLYI